MIRKHFHKKRTLINVTAQDRWRQTQRSRTIEKEQKLQPTTHLELNIGLGFDAKNVWGLSALFEVCLFA